MGGKLVEVTISVLIVVLVIYLMKWAFVRNIQVPILSDVLREI